MVTSFGFHRTTIYKWRRPDRAEIQHSLGVTAVGALLAKLGLTPQKPLQRTYQRDPDAIEAWRLERFPAIARQAKTSGGEVYFWDEFGFRADTVHGKTWGKKGETPVVERPGQRQSISAALGGERPWRILVLHLPWRADGRVVCHPVPHPTTGGIRL